MGPLPEAKQHGSGGASSASVASSASSSSEASSAVTSSSVTSSSAAGGAQTSSGTGGCCDCDGDKYDAVALCGGMDCDDHDPEVYPGEPTYHTMPSANPDVGFDWDCSGSAEPDPTLNMAIDCPPVGLPCPGPGPAFLAKSPPPCGMSGSWGTCTQNGAGCVKNVMVAAQIMKCK